MVVSLLATSIRPSWPAKWPGLRIGFSSNLCMAVFYTSGGVGAMLVWG
jgi:hypothetical protein